MPRATARSSCVLPLGEPYALEVRDVLCKASGLTDIGAAEGWEWVVGRYHLAATGAWSTLGEPVEFDQVVLFSADSAGSGLTPRWRLETDRRVLFISDVAAVQRQEGLVIELVLCLNGTGGCSREYVLAIRGLQFIERAFIEELSAMLPPGLRLHKGMTLDLTTLEGVWPVAATGDANCCPSWELVYEVALIGSALKLVNAELRERWARLRS